MKAIIIQARMSSTRMPGKILKLLSGKPMLFHIVERCRKSKRADVVAVATTRTHADDVVEQFCADQQIPCFRGSEEDVLARYYQAAEHLGATTIVRVTADCPLISPELIDECLLVFETGKWDYASNVIPGKRMLLRGLDVEVFSFSALGEANRKAKEIYEREHVTPYLWENKSGDFRVSPMVEAATEYNGDYRLTVDYPEDFSVIESVYQALYRPGLVFKTREAIAFLDRHPEVLKRNAHCVQKSF